MYIFLKKNPEITKSEVYLLAIILLLVITEIHYLLISEINCLLKKEQWFTAFTWPIFFTFHRGILQPFPCSKLNLKAVEYKLKFTGPQNVI